MIFLLEKISNYFGIKELFIIFFVLLLSSCRFVNSKDTSYQPEYRYLQQLDFKAITSRTNQNIDFRCPTFGYVITNKNFTLYNFVLLNATLTTLS